MHQLGPPIQVSALPDGFAFLYDHWEIGEYQLGISVNYSFLRYLKYVKAWNYLKQDLLLMTFDNQGRLRGIGAEHRKDDLGGGSALQLIVSVASLTDASAFQTPADAHSWGAARLKRLPSALNSMQNLASGANGLQLRTASAYVGQHAMDMTKPKNLKSKKRNEGSEPF
jgi:hypothetical protein